MDAVEFRDHSLWVAVASTMGTISTALPPDPPWEIERVQALGAHIASFKEAPKELFSAAMLSSVEGVWTNLHNSVSNYAGSSGSNYLPQISQYCDQVLSSLSQWPYPFTRALKGAAANEAYRTLVDQALSATAEAGRTVEGLRSAISVGETDLMALRQKITDLAAVIDSQTLAIREAATTQTTAFNAAQTERTSSFESWLVERNRDHESSEAAAQAVLRGMEALHAKTEKVAGAATSAVLARDFGSYSNREFWSAVLAFVVGILAILGAGAYLLWAMSSLGPEQNATWQWVTMKFGVTATIVGGASVAIALGNKFLRNASGNKRVELELRAIGPFLADVDDDEAARKVKLDFVDRVFGHAWETPANDADADINVNALTKVTESFARFAQRAP